MENGCLDVDAIRETYVARDASTNAPPAAGMTRRTFLAVGATAATAARAGATRTFAPLLTFARSRQGFRFLLDGHEAWSIDPSRFAGTPRLDVTTRKETIEIQLSGARFPGTSIPANLACRCERRRRWTIDVSMEAGSFSAAGDLLEWLTKCAPLISRISLRQSLERSPLAAFTSRIEARRAEFRPDWTLAFPSDCWIDVTMNGTPIRAAGAVLRLGSNPSRSFLKGRPKKTTSLSIHRGALRWELERALARPPAGEVFISNETFDGLDVVFDESPRGPARVVAQSAGVAAGTIYFRPGDRFVDPESKPIVLPLRDPSFAFAAGAATFDSALVARFSKELPWLAVDDSALQLAGSEDPSFEIVGRNGALQTFRCAPNLIGSLVPLDGDVITQSMPMPCDTKVAIHHDAPKNDGQPEQWGSVTSCGGEGNIELLLPNCCISVARPDDLLNICFELQNLRVRKRLFHAPVLEPTGSGEPMVIVHFPPQAILERAFLEDALGSDCPTDPPVDSRLSGYSRVAFKIPRCEFDGDGLPFTLASLLAWDRFEQSLVDEIRKLDKIAPPRPHQTAIEAPYRLVMSPERSSMWRHSDEPVSVGGRTELWHTRLFRTGDAAKEDSVPKVRAVWSPDFQPTAADPVPIECPFRASLNPRDRHRIVRLTHDLATGPEPVNARLFALSALGAWLDLHGFWDWTVARQAIPLEKWDHEATMGRDQHVVVENRGFLYPFGHKCVLVKETERKVQPSHFDSGRPSSYVAYLRQRKYIRVKEPVKEYDPPTADFSFLKVEYKDRVTPSLDPIRGIRRNCATTPRPPAKEPPKPGECKAADDECDPVNFWCEQAFWPEVAGRAFRFRIEGTDRAGNLISFDAPAIFIEDRIADTQDCLPKSCGDTSDCTPLPGSPFRPSVVLPDAACEYQEDNDRRVSTFSGQTHALSQSMQKGDTEIEAQRVYFFHNKTDIERPPFRPIIERIEGRVPALDTLARDGGVAWFVLDDPDDAANHSQTFAHIILEDGQRLSDANRNPSTKTASPLQARFNEQSDRSGGIAAPRPDITELSRSHGAIGAPPPATSAGQRNAIDSFFHTDAKLFGVIELSQIIAALDFGLPDSIPAMLSTLIPSTDGPDEITQTINWRTRQLQNHSIGDIFAFEKGENAELSIEGFFQFWLDPDYQPRFSMRGALTDFAIALTFSGSGVRVRFDSIQFISGSELTSDVDVKIAGVDFLGALAFVQKLQDFLKLPGGAQIDLRSDGVTVSMPALKIPSIPLGAFSLQDLLITASLDLSFRDKPVVLNFDFCSPARPFLVNVGVFAGGGFFGVGVTSNGLQRLAAAFEFGAQKALDFGVATGRLYVMGGLFYSQEGSPGSLTATYSAYVRAGGELHAFGCLSFGVDLYVALSAMDNGRESYLIGIATLTYSFEIAFVKKSFSISYQQRFAGSSSSRSGNARLNAPQNALVASFVADVGGSSTCANAEEFPVPDIAALMPKDEWIRYWTAFAGARK